jgi:hypothetical protein
MGLGEEERKSPEGPAPIRRHPESQLRKNQGRATHGVCHEANRGARRLSQNHLVCESWFGVKGLVHLPMNLRNQKQARYLVMILVIFESCTLAGGISIIPNAVVLLLLALACSPALEIDSIERRYFICHLPVCLPQYRRHDRVRILFKVERVVLELCDVGLRRYVSKTRSRTRILYLRSGARVWGIVV